jgi:hypothetical protein
MTDDLDPIRRFREEVPNPDGASWATARAALTRAMHPKRAVESHSRSRWRMHVRGWRPLALLAALVLGGTAAALAATGAFQTQSEAQRAERYIAKITNPVLNTPVCATAPRPKATNAPPPASLASVLRVLRRPAQPGGVNNVLAASVLRVVPGLYRDSVRLARTAFGIDFYLYVASELPPFLPIHESACLEAQTAAFHHELHTIPPQLRPLAKTDFAVRLRSRGPQRLQAKLTQPTLAILALRPSGVGAGSTAGGVASTASPIEHGEVFQTLWRQRGHDYHGILIVRGHTTGPPLIAGVVPNGVATVTLYYPAHQSNHGPAVPAEALRMHAINNLVVGAIPRNPLAPTMVWRTSNGRIIRSFVNWCRPGASCT